MSRRGSPRWMLRRKMSRQASRARDRGEYHQPLSNETFRIRADPTRGLMKDWLL